MVIFAANSYHFSFKTRTIGNICVIVFIHVCQEVGDNPQDLKFGIDSHSLPILDVQGRSLVGNTGDAKRGLMKEEFT